MEMNIKTPSDSQTIMTEMVMPNDTNPLGNLMGGNLLRWMDVAGGICARRHAETICVTAAVDSVSFERPIRLGEIVTITAKATCVFRTSMEIHLIVEAEPIDNSGKFKSNEAYLTFVGLDRSGNKVVLPKLKLETEAEKKACESAYKRREYRLISAGRMKAKDSKYLKSAFV